jgi:uncharacterized protein YndB with AHSA1/START domain
MCMTTLRHAIKIAAPRAETFKAVSDMREMAAWHLGLVEGDIAPGAVLYLAAKPTLRFGWRTEELIPDRRLRQTCIEGPGTSAGKTLTIEMSDLADGGTLVELTDGEWREGDAHLPFCNTRWGQVLHRLKEHVERTRS